MKDKQPESMRVSMTLHKDTSENIFAILCQTEKNRGEIVRRLLEFAINQFPEDTLSARNILNGSFYLGGRIQPPNSTEASFSNDNNINNEKVNKIASNINF